MLDLDEIIRSVAEGRDWKGYEVVSAENTADGFIVELNVVEEEEPMERGQTYTMDITGCARCHGPGHTQLVFKPLTHPIEGFADGYVATHFAVCPTNGEPILNGAAVRQPESSEEESTDG